MALQYNCNELHFFPNMIDFQSVLFGYIIGDYSFLESKEEDNNNNMEIDKEKKETSDDEEDEIKALAQAESWAETKRLKKGKTE